MKSEEGRRGILGLTSLQTNGRMEREKHTCSNIGHWMEREKHTCSNIGHRKRNDDDVVDGQSINQINQQEEEAFLMRGMQEHRQLLGSAKTTHKIHFEFVDVGSQLLEI